MPKRTLNTLPREIIFQVAEYLTPGGLAALVSTSRFFAQTLSSRLYDTLIFNKNKPLNRMGTHPESLLIIINSWESEFAINYFESKAGKLLTARGHQEMTLLHILAASSNTRLLDMLLAGCSGEKIDPRNGQGETPLHMAIKRGRAEAAIRLISAGADVLARATGGTPILSLVRPGFPKHAAQALLEAVRSAGGDIWAADNDGGQVPLHYAALQGDEELVNLLIVNGADVLATNDAGHHPLVTSVLAGHINVSRVLFNAMEPLGYGINRGYPRSPESLKWVPEDPWLFSREGDTLLHYAVLSWNISMVQFLLKSGANPLAVNSAGQTPFDIAVRGRAPKMVEAIVAATQDDPPEFWTSNGYLQDGFDTCVAEAYPGTVRTLLDLRRAGKVDLDVNHEILPGELPLLRLCAYYGQHRSRASINGTIRCVVDAGANVNIQNGQGKTPLHSLCDNDSEYEIAILDMVKYLIAAGADWRLRDNKGNTTLHCAARRFLEDVVEYLVSIAPTDGNALYLKNSDGQTALDIAEEYDCTRAIKALNAFNPNGIIR